MQICCSVLYPLSCPSQQCHGCACNGCANGPEWPGLHLRWAHSAPLLVERHWLPAATRIRFKSLMLTCRALAGSVPLLLEPIPTCPLHSARERHGSKPSVEARPSRLFSNLAPQQRNSPLSSGGAEAIFSFFTKSFWSNTLCCLPPHSFSTVLLWWFRTIWWYFYLQSSQLYSSFIPSLTVVALYESIC